jgi:hypothetical protein
VQDPDRGPTFHHRQGAEDEEDAGGDFIPITHKLKFLKYDGVGDPLPWLNRCEQYFCIWLTLEHKQVAYVVFHLLDDVQLSYHQLKINSGPPTWNRFIQLVNTRFRPPLTDSPIGELTLLHRNGLVDDYAK